GASRQVGYLGTCADATHAASTSDDVLRHCAQQWRRPHDCQPGKLGTACRISQPPKAHTETRSMRPRRHTSTIVRAATAPNTRLTTSSSFVIGMPAQCGHSPWHFRGRIWAAIAGKVMSFSAQPRGDHVSGVARAVPEKEL